jgi:hypothetical protein
MRHPRTKHPIRQTPLAILLSRLSLPAIVAIYGVLTATWILACGLGLYWLDPRDASITDALRRSTWAMWGADNLLSQDGKSALYYTLGIVNGAVSITLPVFLLGAFVFKLFRHDPLQWRRTLTVEAHPSGSFVLAARFYNRFTVDISDLRVRAWIRWIPDESETVRRNRRLELLGTLPRDVEDALPLAAPGEPTTTRILLDATSATTDPLDGGGTLLVAGERIPRQAASIVIIVDGLAGVTNEAFRSTKVYSLQTDLSNGGYQNIPLDAADGAEWDNFDGVQREYLFVYGAMLPDLESLAQGAAGAAELPTVALAGWKRSWCVATDLESLRTYDVHGDGASNNQFVGTLVGLGLVRDEGSCTLGVLVEVGYSRLAGFDLQGRNYRRMDVTSDVLWQSMSRPVDSGARVYAYVPRRGAVQGFHELRAAGNAAVDRAHLLSVREAADRLGPQFVRNFDDAQRYPDVPVLDLAPAADA